jgi:hypothetical protein
MVSSRSVQEKQGSMLPSDGHVGQLLVADHGGDALQILVGGGADAPAPGPVVLAGNHEMMAFAARGFDRGQTDAADGQFAVDLGLERAGFDFVEALTDDANGLEDLEGADEDA